MATSPPGVYVPLKALFLVSILFIKVSDDHLMTKQISDSGHHSIL